MREFFAKGLNQEQRQILKSSTFPKKDDDKLTNEEIQESLKSIEEQVTKYMLSQWNLEESICERYESDFNYEKNFEQAMLEISNETE